MIDNEKFDKQMTGVRKQKDKTEIYAFVDTAVAGDKVAAVTLVSRTTGKKLESPLIPSLKVDEMKVIRNTTIVYSQKDSKVVDTRNVHTAPDYLDPSKISETATLANAALVRFALDNDEKRRTRTKTLGTRAEGFEYFKNWCILFGYVR